MDAFISSFNQTADRTGTARVARIRVSTRKCATICVSARDFFSPSFASALLCVRALFSPIINGFSVHGRKSGYVTRKL